jgi:hypothetical protein
MEMVFHVFVDGVTATAPDAVRTLAHAISAHYGVAAADVYARLMRGSFRVKANVDEATAHLYARDLSAIGAQVRIEAADAPVVSVRPTRAGLSVLAELPPRAAVDVAMVSGRLTKSGLGVLPPPQPGTAARPTRSGLTPQAPTPVPRATQPGLSPPRTTTPALAIATPARSTKEAEDIAFALSALDAGDVSLAMLDNVSPPERTAPTPRGPYASPPALVPSARPERPIDRPVDLFAPPEAAMAESIVELAPDELAYRESKRQASVVADLSTLKAAAKWPQSPPRTSPQIFAAPRAPAPSRTVSSSSPGLRAAAQAATAAAQAPLAPAQSAELAAAAPRRRAAPRARFAAGVALAIVLGFVPADLIASWRERDAFRAIDAHVSEVQAAADAPATYATLDAFRADQLAAKRSARRLSVLTALVVWAAAGGAISYVWFRRVRWPEAAPDAPG